MARTTVKNAEACAKGLARDLGKKFGDCWDKVGNKNVAKVGCWKLDVGHQNRVVIEEISNTRGGVRTPLGDGRLKPGEFCDASRMARRALEVSRE